MAAKKRTASFSSTEWIYAKSQHQTFLVGERTHSFRYNDDSTTGERLYNTAKRDSRFQKVWIDTKLNQEAIPISPRLYNMYTRNKTGGKIETYVYCIPNIRKKENSKKSKVCNHNRKAKGSIQRQRKKTKK